MFRRPQRCPRTATLFPYPTLFRSAVGPGAPRPLVVALCGAQGSGKSTLAAALADRLTAAGHRTAILALDDLYLPAAERAALARTVQIGRASCRERVCQYV